MKTLYQKKMIRIGILVMIIGGLTIGFATFSNTLNIKSQTTVSPSSDNFKLAVSGSESDQNIDTITPNIVKNHKDLNASVAKITKSGDKFTISNISVSFSGPGQLVEYYFYIHNIGKLDSYWKKTVFNKGELASNIKINCIAKEGTTDSLVQEACKSMLAELHYKKSGATIWTAVNQDINYRIVPEEILQLRFIISYRTNTQNQLNRADGPFDIEIGDVELQFSSTP